MTEPDSRFPTGTLVEKFTGDYSFRGLVVAVFKKQSGQIRFVVENQDGILHIYSEKNLRLPERIQRDPDNCKRCGNEPDNCACGVI